MNPKTEPRENLYLSVYLALVGLTVLTVACSAAGFAPILGVTAALSVAGMKAGLIGYYFMHLGEERSLIVGIAAAGVLAVLALALGILPDIALRL
ncbi:MAG: cytochrome C oxidase subunit IV family protein [Elusimicrobia bacterium]|nr:cytochrome C oxidase subunit IV family protein [Elusimicrobiota bacterium]